MFLRRLSRLISVCLIAMIPIAVMAEKLSVRESRCVTRCDTMRYQCSKTINRPEHCARGRESCMERCMGKTWSEAREKQRQQVEGDPLPKLRPRGRDDPPPLEKSEDSPGNP